MSLGKRWIHLFYSPQRVNGFRLSILFRKWKALLHLKIDFVSHPAYGRSVRLIDIFIYTKDIFKNFCLGFRKIQLLWRSCLACRFALLITHYAYTVALVVHLHIPLWSDIRHCNILQMHIPIHTDQETVVSQGQRKKKRLHKVWRSWLSHGWVFMSLWNLSLAQLPPPPYVKHEF